MKGREREKSCINAREKILVGSINLNLKEHRWS